MKFSSMGEGPEQTEAQDNEVEHGEFFVLDPGLVSIVPIPGSPLTKLADEIERRLHVRLPSEIDSRGHHLYIDEVSWVTMSVQREFCFNLLIRGREDIPFFTEDAAIMAEFIMRYLEARAEAEAAEVLQ